MVELVTYVGHYKYGKQEKKTQDVSPWRLLPLQFLSPPILPMNF